MSTHISQEAQCLMSGWGQCTSTPFPRGRVGSWPHPVLDPGGLLGQRHASVGHQGSQCGQ